MFDGRRHLQNPASQVSGLAEQGLGLKTSTSDLGLPVAQFLNTSASILGLALLLAGPANRGARDLFSRFPGKRSPGSS